MDLKQPHTDLSTFNNSWYNPGRGVLIRFLWMFCSKVWVNSWFPFSGFKKFILVLFGAKIGRNVVIKPHVNIKYPWKLQVGDNVWIGEYVWIDNLGEVRISSDVCISQGALLICGNHDYRKSAFDLLVGDIELKEGTWLGAKSIVTGSSILNSHVVVTAGSVFSGESESYTIYRGNPAVKVRKRVLID